MDSKRGGGESQISDILRTCRVRSVPDALRGSSGGSMRPTVTASSTSIPPPLRYIVLYRFYSMLDMFWSSAHESPYAQTQWGGYGAVQVVRMGGMHTGCQVTG